MEKKPCDMTTEELNEYFRSKTATVGELIDYLIEKFNPEDNVVYMDCIEGVKNDCTYVTKDQLGDRFFYYVSDLKKSQMERNKSTKEEADDVYPYVKDEDVVMI